jgi:hypothetical protein
MRAQGTLACWGANGSGQAPALAIDPPTLPAGTIGIPYSQPLSVSGGSPAYQFALGSGSLPLGLSLSAGGAISGAPAVEGQFNFIVRVTDAFGFTGERAYTLTVGQPPRMYLPLTLR